MVEDTTSSTDHQEDPIKLLVVEDDPAMLIAFQDVLKGAGFEVLSASNGEAALELLGHTQPALILSDISMPIMDGWTLVKTLRSRPAFAVLPLIILTDQDSAESRMQGFRLGADDFVSKGTIVEELEVRIARAMERTEAIKRALGISQGGQRASREGGQRSALESGIFQPAMPGGAASTPQPAVPERPLDLPPLSGGQKSGDTPQRAGSSPPSSGTPGMTGTLDQIGLASILTLLSTGGKSGILNVVRADEGDRGQIFLREGDILRVRVESNQELRHADGIAEIMRWSNAQFAFSLQDVTSQDEMNLPTEHLLMEASRLMDESTH